MNRPVFKSHTQAVAYLSACLDNIKPQKRHQLEWLLSALVHWNVKRNDIKASHRVIGARVRPNVKPNSQRVFSQRAMNGLCRSGVLSVRDLTKRGVNILSINWTALWRWLKNCGPPSPKKCGTNRSYKNSSSFFDLGMWIKQAIDAQERRCDEMVKKRVSRYRKKLNEAGVGVKSPAQRKLIDRANKKFNQTFNKDWQGPTEKGASYIEKIRKSWGSTA